MLRKRMVVALNEKLPVLFAYIGWAPTYDGTEPISGGHGYLKEHPYFVMSCGFGDSERATGIVVPTRRR